MWHRWQAVLALALVTLCYVEAKPTTQETLVVSRAEESTTTAPPASEATSEEPTAPVKMTEMDVKSRVSLRYAHTAVVARVRNPAARAQETSFRMLLPDTAFISGFTMTIDGKVYKAYVKEKEEAKKIYNDAVSQGFGAAHVAAKARDSNHFTVSVNVEPSSIVVFNLTYEELLVRRNGVYNHAINLHPGALVPKMQVTVHIKEAEKISALRVPEIRTGNEVDASEDDPQNTNAVIKRTHDDREATITFNPDIAEQKRLIQVYAEKSKESLGNQHRYYPEDAEDEKDKEGFLGQFVVQYDVDRSKAGEILVSDGYFVHFFAPTSLPPLPKHVVFVLDTSGSMMGRKVEQLREAIQTILTKLNPGDSFNIIEFNSHVKVHDLSEADKPETSTSRYYYYDRTAEAPTLVPPSPATPENIAKAKIIVSRLDAGGGTNIASALDVAVDVINKGYEKDTKIEKTDNKSQSETKTDEKTDVKSESTTDDASENKTTKEPEPETNQLEPIIIFLTDGDPTVGETNPTRIISRLSEKNYGKRKAAIFSLAFGEDADRKFLRKLSLRNAGFMRHIYEAADAALQLRDFYRSVASPLLADVKFLYPKAQIKEGSTTKDEFHTFYAGSETVVAGRVADGAAELQPQVLAFCGNEDGVGRKRYEISPKVPVVRSSEHFYPLERLWAYLTIKQLLDEKDALIESKSDKDKETKNDLEKKALGIALKYEFVTPLTSLVVVKPNDTKAVDAESVDSKSPNEHLSLGGAGFAGSRPLLAAPYHSIPAPSISLDSYMHRPVAQLMPIAASADDAYPLLDLTEQFPLALEEEEPDGVGASFGAGFLTTPAPRPLAYRTGEPSTEAKRSDSSEEPSTTTEQASTSSPLELYSLEEFSWVLPLLDAASDSLILNVNGTQLHLKLAKDITAAPTDGAACEAGGAAARCRYLPRCAAARALSVDLYQAAYCELDNGYAGVCCPITEGAKENP
ncbi:inter-alpha-trypsin inhibitor heavy chain H4-like isoform X2 [Epargyreus clarus]|uniref:inter-alpha-trypsin inhibitor heavy chain H4-like isoform X2 n=1 Tax=Epargyreus clarus TaxID=520877 RepID=UPI003C2CB535